MMYANLDYTSIHGGGMHVVLCVVLIRRCYSMCTQPSPYNWSEALYKRHGEVRHLYSHIRIAYFLLITYMCGYISYIM
jgi:hypothetical protein